MENFRKKNQTENLEIKSSLNQIKNTGESHSSRLEHTEDRTLGVEDKIDITEKTEELLDRKFKKENTRTQQLYQKTKPANYGHQRKRRGASQRDM
jgi:hypothetical protein